MGVGPPGRTGRDQLIRTRAFLARPEVRAADVVIVGCERSAAGGLDERADGVAVMKVSCAGSVHTSVIENLVRGIRGGVLVVSCPARDCSNREGPKWLEQRMYHEREAELKSRVDRTRVRLVWVAEAEGRVLARELAAFRAQLAELEPPAVEEAFDVVSVCERAIEEEVTR
jgi:coenzyme F420-reducing hydrogenase delta subunit